jgi:hypothetical protein
VGELHATIFFFGKMLNFSPNPNQWNEKSRPGRPLKFFFFATALSSFSRSNCVAMGKQTHKKKAAKRANPLATSQIPNGMADIVPKEEEIIPILQKVSYNSPLSFFRDCEYIVSRD